MATYTININERTKQGKFFLSLLKEYSDNFEGVTIESDNSKFKKKLKKDLKEAIAEVKSNKKSKKTAKTLDGLLDEI